GVHAAKLLDRLNDKKEQDQAYNEIHCCKAFDRTPASPEHAAADLIVAEGETTPNSRSAHLRQQEPRGGIPLRLPTQRSRAAGGIGRRRAQERREPRGSASVEGAVGSPGEAGDLSERAPGRGVLPLLEHERLDAEQRQLSRERSERVRIFLHGVADKDERSDLGALGFI